MNWLKRLVAPKHTTAAVHKNIAAIAPAPLPMQPPPKGVLQFDGGLVIYNGQELPSYPDRGRPAPAAPPELLLESQIKRIDQLHQASSFSRVEFDEYVLPAILAYAAYVHLLPASETQHHCTQGGLFTHGLEVAYNAALACEGRVFAFDHWPSERANLVPRWRMCALLGGMLHDTGKPVIDVGAVDQGGQLSWNPHAAPLYDWLVEHNLSHYYIHWRSGPRHKRHEAFNTVLFYKIVPQKTIRWLAEAGQDPLNALIMALSGSKDPTNPLSSIISNADSKSVSADIQATRVRLAASGFGGANSLAMRISRALHDLIQIGAWPINKPGHPVWVTTHGVFLLGDAFQQVAQVLRDKGDNSIPNDGREMIETLADWGYLHPNILPSGQQFHTWQIRLHAMDRGKPMTIDVKAVRWAKDDLLPRDMILPEPIEVEIIGQNQQPVGQGGVVTAARNVTPATTETPEQSRPTDEAREDAIDQTSPAPQESKPVPEQPLKRTRNLLSMDDPVTRNRDRSAEPNPRDEIMHEARDQMNSRWPPATPEAAEAYFHGQGDPGAIVIALCGRVGKVLAENEHVWDIDDRIHFRYPEAFEQLGMPEADIRALLEARGWTERAAETPTKSTVMLDVAAGRKAVTIRFTKDISLAMQNMLPVRSGDAFAKATNGGEKRVLPMGPYIDADIAGSIRDRITMDPQDSPLIRPCFHAFALMEVEKQERSLESLTEDELQVMMNAFTKSHGLTSGVWLSFHLLRGESNVWGKKHDPKKKSFIFNPEYRVDLDIREQAARGIV